MTLSAVASPSVSVSLVSNVAAYPYQLATPLVVVRIGWCAIVIAHVVFTSVVLHLYTQVCTLYRLDRHNCELRFVERLQREFA